MPEAISKAGAPPTQEVAGGYSLVVGPWLQVHEASNRKATAFLLRLRVRICIIISFNQKITRTNDSKIYEQINQSSNNNIKNQTQQPRNKQRVFKTTGSFQQQSTTSTRNKQVFNSKKKIQQKDKQEVKQQQKERQKGPPEEK